jgi:tetratricopeptide (TPR) repeat protein
VAPLNCPLCGRTLTAPASECPVCRGDLRPLAQIAALADEHFNKAVALARAEQWHRAAEHLAVTRALSPNDVDAIVLLAKVRYRQRGGQRAEATQLLRRALELAPDREDVRSALEEAARPQRQRRQGWQRRRR